MTHQPSQDNERRSLLDVEMMEVLGVEDAALRKRGENLLDEDRIQGMLSKRKPCCKRSRCTQKFSVEEVVALRKGFASLNDMERRVTLAKQSGLTAHAMNVNARTYANTDCIHVNEKSICMEAFRRIYGVSKDLWKRVLHLSATSVDYAAHEVLASEQSEPHHMTKKLKHLFGFFLEHMRWRTEVIRKDGRARHLLAGIETWTDLFASYKQWCDQQQIDKKERAGEEYFHLVRRRDHPDFVLDKRSDLPTCSICVRLNRLLLRTDLQVDELRLARHMKAAHRQLERGEWLAYNTLTTLAQNPDGEYVFVAIDGSDSRALPHYGNNSPCPSLETHWIGVHVISPEVNRRAIYIHFPQLWKREKDADKEFGYPLGPDLGLSVLLLELQLLFKAQQKRPEFLILHTDNTVRYRVLLVHALTILCTDC